MTGIMHRAGLAYPVETPGPTSAFICTLYFLIF
jgi:hypothetical protein